jgi:hypothetical protein
MLTPPMREQGCDSDEPHAEVAELFELTQIFAPFAKGKSEPR